MRPLMLAVLAGALLGACGKTELKPTPPSYAEERLKLTALELRLGEDAYRQPEVDEILKRLAQVPNDAPNRDEAVRLGDWLRAKRRLSIEANTAPPPPRDTKTPSMGPLPGTGEAPEAPAAIATAEDIKVGTSREQLVRVYGSCLTRQTWFRGARGGPSTELFHVAPECRSRLTPRVFTVFNAQVGRIAPGNLDGVMTTNPKDTPDPEEGGEGR